MPTLKDIDRVFECEVNTVVVPPFTTTLPAGGTVSLCSIAVPARRAGYLVRAVVNWSATFTPPVFTVVPTIITSGFAQITFEILRDGGPIARVFQTAFSPVGAFPTPATTFEIATLQILDTQSLSGITNPISLFEVRATNIILVPPLLNVGLASASAAAGLVSLVVEEIDVCRAASVDA